MQDVRQAALLARVKDVAADRDRGAAAILADLLPLLDYTAREQPASLFAVRDLVRREQPVMVGLHAACRAALADAAHPGALAAFIARAERAPRAIARVAGEWLRTGAAGPLHVVTWSASSLVEATVAALAAHDEVTVSCGEARPRLEGHALAAALAGSGARVRVFTDGALATAVPGATALLVGADAVAATEWVNKAGTSALAAWARHCGVAIAVLAGPEKFGADADTLGEALASAERPPGEVWRAAPRGIVVENPPFERIPLDLADVVISDRGPLLPVDVPRFAGGLGW
jgi:ribose 1,5-bisphosphate isomerase